MRLIDADALFEELNKKQIPWNRRINDIIMAQPTAYDVEKVVEQLEKDIEDYKKDFAWNYVAGIEYALEILRNGGKE